ncbi:hypothetical protein HAX54_011169 [Datura stramonium]|uniref:Uncharacterized protein n=1 Tax=Datura stramonium TaxID=4076 RepID=A0ABS8WYE7_DATST|nr:hypothetical protein [Datura stramonium]
MAGYKFRLATSKEARNEFPLYLKKKPLPFSLPDQWIQSNQVKPPFSLERMNQLHLVPFITRIMSDNDMNSILIKKVSLPLKETEEGSTSAGARPSDSYRFARASKGREIESLSRELDPRAKERREELYFSAEA